MTYFKYVERDVKDQINWAEVGKGVTDMLKAETVARENEKQKIKDRSRAFGEQLSNSPTGDYDAGNTFIGDFSNGMQEYRLLQDRLLQSGELNLRDYTRNRQNNTSGTTQMFDLAKEYQAEYAEKMKRWDGDESSFREVWEMEQAEGLANLRNVGGFINPTNGVVSIAKRLEGGGMSDNPNDFATVPELRSRLKQKYNRFDLNAFADASADSLGEIENSVVQYASEGNLNTIVTEVNAMKGDYTDEQKAFVATYNEWEDAEANIVLGNANKVSSVLTDRGKKAPNGKAYTFTYSKDEFDTQGEGGNLIYLDRDAKSGAISGKPLFTKAQEEDVKDTVKMAIRARIDQKSTTKGAGTTPFKPQNKVTQENTEDLQVNVVNNFAKLYYGTAEEKLAAANSLRGFNPNVGEIRMSDDGLGIQIDFNDGRDSEIITFGDDQRAFVESGMNFVLPDKDKISNLGDVAGRANMNFDKPVLSGTDYNFSSKGQGEVKLPFDQAFKQNEGAKLKSATVVSKAGAAITKEEETAAVTELKSQISQLPGLDKVTVREFNVGRGLVITIPAKGKGSSAVKKQRFDIDLKDANKAQTELDKVYEILLNLSLQQQNILLSPEQQKQYVNDYGTGKEAPPNPNPDPKPKPPKPPRPGE
tara:strand:- start:1987 stop:3918 length:1932 start_codon:yes stop_codon:yes gene_type:complete